MISSSHRIIALLSFFLLFCLVELPAQQNSKAPDARFGEIPDSLAGISQPSEAPYLITNKEMDVSFRESENSIVAVIRHHVRLKVFDETAREASVVTIPYYFDEGMETISEIRGMTYLPSGKQIPLREKQIKTININSRYNVKEFRMPRVEDGAVLEYSYTINRRYIEELPEFFLSHNVPTSQAKITITYPKYLRYQPYVENFKGSIQHDFVYTDTSSVPKIFTIPQPEPIIMERWVAYDIPATEQENFISSPDDYRGKMKFLLSEFGIPRQQLENSWEVVVAKMRRNSNPWKAVSRNKLAASVGDSIAQSHGSVPEEALQDSIFRFLNQKVNFSGGYAPYSTRYGSEVVSGKPADQAAINQTLVAMLRGAGIDAWPLLISSRRSGRVDKDFPSFFQFNAQLVFSRIGDQTYVMDASFPHSQPGLIPVDMYNRPGLLLKRDSFDWVTFNPAQSKFDIAVRMNAKLHADGTLEGEIISYQSGYPAQLIRRQKADGQNDAEILKRTLFDGFARLSADSVQINRLHSYSEPVEIKARFTIENYATSFTDGLKFRPMMVGYQLKNPFRNTDRDLPVTLDAPEKLDVTYAISLPDGYETDEGRQNHTLTLPGAEFEEIYNMKQEKLNYEYHIDIRQKEFSRDLFPQLYNLYQRWVELSNTAWLIKN